MRFDLRDQKWKEVCETARGQINAEKIANITPPLFLRDTGTREIYALDVDFP